MSNGESTITSELKLRVRDVKDIEKKYQDVNGSVDEKIETVGFKMRQYQKVAAELGIQNVYFVYILGDFFKNPYYHDALEYIRSIPNCDYYFVETE